jgi:uncharacterized protein
MTDAADEFDNLRDRHLFGKGPKKLLALDGGGVRGAITVAFLEQIEKIVSQEEQSRAAADAATRDASSGRNEQLQNKTIRLGDYFDLVGGTSTGAIIAGALALGHTISEIKDFYLRLAPRVFTRPLWRLPFLQAKFDARALTSEINEIVKDRTLDSPDLITGLAIIAKRLDTGSPWIVLNNQRAPYWHDKPGVIGNKHYRLANLVRASTAAPHYFDPEILPILQDVAEDPLGSFSPNLTNLPLLSFLFSKLRALYLSQKDPHAERHGLFVDGGVTPFNNPTFALLMHAALKPLGIRWPLGPENLTIFSIGTGTYRARVSFAEIGLALPLGVAVDALLSLMSDTENLALAQMQWLGECLTPWPINSELGTLQDESPPGGHWFRFARYDVRLEANWLLGDLGIDLNDKEVNRLRRMDDPGTIETIYAIARLAAEKQVKREHFFSDTRPNVAQDAA